MSHTEVVNILEKNVVENDLYYFGDFIFQKGTGPTVYLVSLSKKKYIYIWVNTLIVFMYFVHTGKVRDRFYGLRVGVERVNSVISEINYSYNYMLVFNIVAYIRHLI